MRKIIEIEVNITNTFPSVDRSDLPIGVVYVQNIDSDVIDAYTWGYRVDDIKYRIHSYDNENVMLAAVSNVILGSIIYAWNPAFDVEYLINRTKKFEPYHSMPYKSIVGLMAVHHAMYPREVCGLNSVLGKTDDFTVDSFRYMQKLAISIEKFGETLR